MESSGVLNTRYRCAEKFDVFSAGGDLAPRDGFFECGKGVVCYGRASVGGAKEARGNLRDALPYVVFNGNHVTLPFDPEDIIENLRRERYVEPQTGTPSNGIQKIYYTFRPLMPVRFRKHLQRMYLSRWRQIAFPRWPVDHTVEEIFETLVSLALSSQQSEEMPFVWFWPEGYSGCLILTHDIETAAGRDRCLDLADLDASYGMKSSFQVVPKNSYDVPRPFLQSLADRGREINLHGLTHDGQLFRDRKQFLEDVKEIRRYAQEYGAAGFRSPVLYRNLDWYADLPFAYDMSVPNVAHLDPQRGGCCTVMPYFVGDILELPLTTTQDYSLFNILGEASIDLWKQQIESVLQNNGLLSFNIHPDYIMVEPFRGLYRQLLAFLQRVCEERNVWIALPGEVNAWWRQREKMIVAGDAWSPRVTGPNSERATLAYARVESGQVSYRLSKTKAASTEAFEAPAELLTRKVPT
jgi:hypothetical protein